MTTAAEILAEYGVEVVGKSAAPGPKQTRAGETVSRILRRHGEGHLRLVLTTLAETANNGGLLDEVGLWMASDMVQACEQLVETRTSEWLELWDAMPLGDLQALCRQLHGIVPQRFALGGMVYERIYRRFGSDQTELFDDRRVM